MPEIPEPASVPPDSTPPPTRRFTLHFLFFDRERLRPIWGILLFLVLFQLTRDTLWIVFGLYLPAAVTQAAPGFVTPAGIFAGEGVVFLAVAFSTFLLAKIECRPIASYGFRRTRAAANFLVGLACGVVLLALLILILRSSGLLVFDARLLFGAAIFRYGAIWLGAFLLLAVVEESFSRGYLQFTLARALRDLYRWLLGPRHADALGFWTAALILSFAFGFGHRANPGESPIGLVAAGLLGLVLCLSLWRTGSLWWAIGFHAAWDWAQSFLFGVADSGIVAQGRLFATHAVGKPIFSGGLTGPEGSLFILAVLALLTLAVIFLLPRNRFTFPAPAEPRRPLHLDLP